MPIKRKFITPWRFLSLLLFVCACLPVAAGQKRPFTRVVSLAPHLTELVFDIGAGQRLVGTVAHSNFPQKARLVERIGNHHALDYEKIVALKPDLVLAWTGGNRPADLEYLRRLGLHVVKIDIEQLDDIPRALVMLDKLLQQNGRGLELAQHFNKLLQRFTSGSRGKSPVKVFMQTWDRPLMTVNSQHYMHDVINRCGGKNIFADMKPLSGTVTREAVILRKPDVILVSGEGPVYHRWLKQWHQWQQVPAVRNSYLYQIKSHTISIPSPRILMGVKRICVLLDQVRQAQ